ncbi:hypothetical protein PS685_05079 [Pseudomonas fluorescens]|uniref:Uncharacterized protein n=1 Tax=Pseudomonas fluorescens TaxID=294 RepID=A0A5E6ZZF2_PSEFL|nr:hypothetical protein PS685_05079 [Pseudomonas fluorescens]
MGRDFHRHGFGTGLFQVGKGRLHGNRVRGGVQAALQRAMETGAQGTDDATMLAEQVQRLRDQLRYAGFTVGAGDADQIQMTARITIKTPRDIRQLRPQALDRNQRHVGDRQHCRAFDFISHGCGTALQGVGNVRSSVEFGARNGEKQIARPHVAAVQGQFADQQIAAGVGENLVQAQGH